jgi:hypothetical protein
MARTSVFALGHLLFLAPFLTPAQVLATSSSVPDVEFVVLRLDYRSYVIEGGYRFTQPFRRAVLPEGFIQAGNIHYRFHPPVDVGFTEMHSRLTGQLVARASSVWSGAGVWEFPTAPIEPVAGGGNAADPVARTYVRRFFGSTLRADTAWASARQAVPLEELAAAGPYEVVIFDHFYTMGAPDPATAEWIVIAFSRPPAPPDVGIVHAAWPFTHATRGVPLAAEATVYNFSDGPETFALRVEVRREGALVHARTVPVGPLASEASHVVTFDPVSPGAIGPHEWSFTLLTPPGAGWSDTFADNDALARGVQVVEDPVFRPVASLARPGPIPTAGEPVDLDGDGDLDLFQYGEEPVLWRRDAGGGYTNITGLTPFAFPPHPRLPVAEDFDGDGHPDLLVTYWESVPVLLRGDGAGAFVDVTAGAGLAGVTGYAQTVALDLEGDGDLDLIFNAQGQETVMINDGLGHFTDGTGASGLVDPSQTEDVAVGDVNDDGRPDVFLTNWNGPFRLFVNDGDGTFTPAPGPWTQTFGRQAMFLDADGDDRQDLLVMHQTRSWLYRNTGGLGFQDVSAAWGVNQPALGGDVADLDLDGLPEVLLTSVADGHVLLSSNGSSFVNETPLLANVDGRYALSYERPRLVDLNEDGLLDVYQQSAIYLHQGLGSEGPAWVDPPGGTAVAAAFPNPFSPPRQAITLRFRLADREPVTATVVDVRGRAVASLMSGVAGPGDVSLQWDGRDRDGRLMPAGIYFGSVAGRAGRSVTRIALLR